MGRIGEAAPIKQAIAGEWLARRDRRDHEIDRLRRMAESRVRERDFDAPAVRAPKRRGGGETGGVVLEADRQQAALSEPLRRDPLIAEFVEADEAMRTVGAVEDDAVVVEASAANIGERPAGRLAPK